MPATTHSRYTTYEVVNAFTGEVVDVLDTRRRANAVKDAHPNRHALRVRGGKVTSKTLGLPWYHGLLLGRGGRR